MSNRGTDRKKQGRRDAQAERSERQRRRGHQEPATWAQADAATLLRAVVAWSEAGGMLGFGKTRDGGALTLCIWEGGEMDREYFRPSDDVTDFLYGLVEEAGKPRVEAPPPDAPRTHQEGPRAKKPTEADRRAYLAALDARTDLPEAEKVRLRRQFLLDGQLTLPA